MLAHICLCFMLIMVTYMDTIHALPTSSSNGELENKKLSDISMFERFGVGTNHFLINDDNSDEDEIVHNKRQLKKKLAKFYQGAQPPYTIAFPALIRTRRWVE